MSETLGKVEANQTSTAERVSRIAAALPDVGVRVAREEIFRAFQGAVLSTIPTQAMDGSWQTTVTVLDTQASKKWTLPIQLTSKDDRQAVYALVGAGVETDRTSTSLYLLQQYSRLAGLDSIWAEIRTAYASGIGLRELARVLVRLDHIASVIVNANHSGI